MNLKATAFAPATVANVAVGFDSLGFAFGVLGDTVTVTRTHEHQSVKVTAIEGVADIPLDPLKNTAAISAAALKLNEKLDFGIDISIQKGIPLGSGMGGSAASAVGAVVALNALLPEPLNQTQLLLYALQGEALASGGLHADNVAPCLWGGMVLSRSVEPSPDVTPLPIPLNLRCVLAHPHLRLDTKVARGVLSPQVSTRQAVQQAAHLGAFVASCFLGDLNLMGRACKDLIFEAQRAHLIPGFRAVQAAALEAGALGCSISGAGPSIFALARAQDAEQVAAAMGLVFKSLGQSCDVWNEPISEKGCTLL